MTQSEIINFYDIISNSLKERFKTYDVELNLNVNPEAVAIYNIITSCLNGVFIRYLCNAEPEKTWVEAVAETKMSRSEPSLVFAANQTPDAPVQTKDTSPCTAAYTDRFFDAVNYVSERLNKDDLYFTTHYERQLERLISEMLFGKELGDEFVAFINCDDEDGEIIFPDKKEMKKFLRTKMYEKTF